MLNRVTGKSYTVPFSYQYNLAGGLICEVYPSQRTIVTAYDSANRVAQVAAASACPAAGVSPGLGLPAYITGSANASGSGSAIQYAPHGAPTFYYYGNHLARQVTYTAACKWMALSISWTTTAGGHY